MKSQGTNAVLLQGSLGVDGLYKFQCVNLPGTSYIPDETPKANVVSLLTDSRFVNNSSDTDHV